MRRAADPGAAALLLQLPEHGKGALVGQPVQYLALGKALVTALHQGLHELVQHHFMHVRTRPLLPLGHDVGKLRRSAPLALEAGDALVDAQAQLDEITARRTGLFQHDGKERVPGVGHGMAARAGAHDIADEGGRAVIQHQTGHQPVAVPGVEQAHIGAFGGQHLRRAGKELAHVGPQHGPAHELGPQAAVLRTELARLVDAQAFPGLAHGRAQTRRHGRISRKGVEFVPLQHVVRQTRRQVGAHGKAGRGPGLAQGPGQGGLETLVAVLAAIPQGVGDGHEPVFGGVKDEVIHRQHPAPGNGLHEGRGMLGDHGTGKDVGDGIHDAASLLECGKDALRIFSQDSRFDGGPQYGVQGAWGCASPGPLPHRRAGNQPVMPGSSRQPNGPKGRQPCPSGAPTPAPAPGRPGPPRR